MHDVDNDASSHACSNEEHWQFGELWNIGIFDVPDFKSNPFQKDVSLHEFCDIIDKVLKAINVATISGRTFGPSMAFEINATDGETFFVCHFDKRIFVVASFFRNGLEDFSRAKGKRFLPQENRK